MQKKKIENTIKEMKANKKCYLCDNDKIFDGVGIQLVSLTESGKIVESFETKDSSASVLIPMCAYHMVMAQEGAYAMTTDNKVIKPSWIEHFESLNDEGLEILKVRIMRQEKDKQKKKVLLQGIVMVQSARKFQEEIKKGIKKEV